MALYKYGICLVAGSATALILESRITSKQKKALIGGGLATVGVAVSTLLKNPLGIVFSSGLAVGTVVSVLAKPSRQTENTSQNVIEETLRFEVSNTSIESLLLENGIQTPRVPRGFKLVLDVYHLNTPQDKIRYFWKESSVDDSQKDWVPASVVKIFPMLAALQKLSALGFDENTSVTFRDTNQKISIRELIWATIVQSSNMTYNRLVQLVGHEFLNKEFLTAYPNTEINTPYIKDEWVAYTRGNSTFASPSIMLQDSSKETELAPTSVYTPQMCKGRSACTKLSDLNDLLSDAILFNSKGVSQGLQNVYLEALSAKKTSGEDFSNSILSNVSGFNFLNFNKHGFNGTSYTQSVLLYDPNKQIAFAISATGAESSKACLNDVGRAIGQLITKLKFER